MKAHRDYYKAFRKEEGGERQPISTLNFKNVPGGDDQGNFYLNRGIFKYLKDFVFIPTYITAQKTNF